MPDPTPVQPAPLPPKRRFNRRWLLLIPLVLVILLVSGLAWASTPWGAPMTEAQTALVSDDRVTVEQGRWLVFRPTDGEPVAGLAYYPGAKVLAESYAPWARQVAAQGYLVALMPMPLNMALLDTGAAAAVMAADPEIDPGAVGGPCHGGVAAASFARGNPAVDGLVLMASLPADGDSLAGRDELAVTFIFASNDGLFTAEDVVKARTLLPPSTTYVEIVGGNHGQFGWYGPQSGDGAAEISRADQQTQIVSATAGLLATIAQEAD